MPAVVYTEQTDEITDLIDRARTANDHEVALVVNAGTTGLRTPLSVRLLRQMSMSAGKTISVISGDPYVQELSRRGGLPTYASVPAFERGIHTVRPHGDDAMPIAAAAGVAAAAPVLAPPPGQAPPRSVVTTKSAGGLWRYRRRPLYFAGAAVVLIVVVLVLFVAPSATVTITLAGQPLSANPTIQGSTDPTAAGQADHVTTTVVSSDQKQTFDAKPTGSSPVPAVAATGTLVLSSKYQGKQPYTLTVSPGDQFATSDSSPIVFEYMGSSAITVTFPPNDGSQLQPGTPNVPVSAVTAGAKGNVGAGSIDKFLPQDPCNNPANQCQPGDFTVSNTSATTGGVDATTQPAASSSDVSSWSNQVNQLEQQLTGQVNSDMQSKAAGKVFAKDPGGNGTTIACTSTPGVPAANAPWTDTTITVDCQGNGSAYNPTDVLTDARADLQAQVPQGNVIDPSSLSCTKPAVTQAATDGTVVLSVSCTGFSEPSIDTSSLRSQLTGKSPGDAKSLIEHRLANVQSVTITQSPIPLFWMPFFSNRISIDTKFVPVTTGGSSSPSPSASPSSS